MILTTLCYVTHNDKILMLHRVRKDRDIHKGKWNGLGGKFEPGETPEECVIREVREESGLLVSKPSLAGLLTWPLFDGTQDYYCFVFTADTFSGELLDESEEGVLSWVEKRDVMSLPMWEGDKEFIPCILEGIFFTGKFEYKSGVLQRSHVLRYQSPAIRPV